MGLDVPRLIALIRIVAGDFADEVPQPRKIVAQVAG